MRALAFTAAIAATLALLAPARAAAQEDYADDGDSYCAFARGVANQESALLLSPQLFLDYGVVNGNDVTTGAGGITSAPPTERLTFGARYSLVAGLARGIFLRQQAAADCDRYRAAAGLSRFVVGNREQVSPGALDAKLTVLRAALPRAREILRNLRTAVERNHATADELEAVQLRVDEMAAAALDAETLRAGLPAQAAEAPAELLRRHRVADDEMEKAEARIRLSEAFDVSVRAGYDRFFGLRDDLPLFGVVSLTINPAILYLGFSESATARARAHFVRHESDAVEEKAELLTARLRTRLAGERRRLDELRVLLADVEGRIRQLDAIDSDRLRRFKEAMWFDWVNLKAESEFLRVHTADLGRALGPDGG